MSSNKDRLLAYEREDGRIVCVGHASVEDRVKYHLDPEDELTGLNCFRCEREEGETELPPSAVTEARREMQGLSDRVSFEARLKALEYAWQLMGPLIPGHSRGAATRELVEMATTVENWLMRPPS